MLHKGNSTSTLVAFLITWVLVLGGCGGAADSGTAPDQQAGQKSPATTEKASPSSHEISIAEQPTADGQESRDKLSESDDDKPAPADDPEAEKPAPKIATWEELVESALNAYRKIASDQATRYAERAAADPVLSKGIDTVSIASADLVALTTFTANVLAPYRAALTELAQSATDDLDESPPELEELIGEQFERAQDEADNTYRLWIDDPREEQGAYQGKDRLSGEWVIVETKLREPERFGNTLKLMPLEGEFTYVGEVTGTNAFGAKVTHKKFVDVVETERRRLASLENDARGVTVKLIDDLLVVDVKYEAPLIDACQAVAKRLLALLQSGEEADLSAISDAVADKVATLDGVSLDDIAKATRVALDRIEPSLAAAAEVNAAFNQPLTNWNETVAKARSDLWLAIQGRAESVATRRSAFADALAALQDLRPGEPSDEESALDALLRADSPIENVVGEIERRGNALRQTLEKKVSKEGTEWFGSLAAPKLFCAVEFWRDKKWGMAPTATVRNANGESVVEFKGDLMRWFVEEGTLWAVCLEAPSSIRKINLVTGDSKSWKITVRGEEEASGKVEKDITAGDKARRESSIPASGSPSLDWKTVDLPVSVAGSTTLAVIEIVGAKGKVAWFFQPGRGELDRSKLNALRQNGATISDAGTHVVFGSNERLYVVSLKE